MTNREMTRRETDAPAAVERAEDLSVFLPRVDICESEKDVVLVADMPGVDENSVDVALDGSSLTIRGRFVPKAPEGYTLTYQEYTSGNYERTFTLGDTIDRGKIKAVVKDGALRLTLPKAEAAQPRQVTVQAG
jgi:HSP20 family molecular chaperone IbpA